MKKNICFFILIVVLSSCSMHSKLKGTKTLRIIDKSMSSIDTTGYPKYLLNYSLNIYKNIFITELTDRLKEGGGSIIVDTGLQITDYTLVLKNFNYKESTESQTINDEESRDYNKKFFMQVCTINAETTLYNSTAEVLAEFSITNFSKEDLTDFPTFANYIGQMIFKSSSKYRVKPLANNIFKYIAEGSAKSTSKAVTKRLKKL